ncbi:hypothetical protein J6TS1_26180 [Siminovitchia terrae]|uniref:DUF5050 domain-containing protein n=1 Tax=Siminovitchia terrae TaxID=1914933 RepID=A0ABQ4KXI0_SIMTE|nr:hypothetical protein J22TS1_50290 [Siminovitchia terrae]GIN96748.1 hypothetical protein J6TS1_26180 [Siminovitchia terrae]
MYIIVDENEKDKIASRVTRYELIGSHIYYLNDDGDFQMYNIKDKQETEIASDVFYFTSLSDKEEVAYWVLMGSDPLFSNRLHIFFIPFFPFCHSIYRFSIQQRANHI